MEEEEHFAPMSCYEWDAMGQDEKEALIKKEIEYTKNQMKMAKKTDPVSVKIDEFREFINHGAGPNEMTVGQYRELLDEIIDECKTLLDASAGDEDEEQNDD